MRFVGGCPLPAEASNQDGAPAHPGSGRPAPPGGPGPWSASVPPWAAVDNLPRQPGGKNQSRSGFHSLSFSNPGTLVLPGASSPVSRSSCLPKSRTWSVTVGPGRAGGTTSTGETTEGASTLPGRSRLPGSRPAGSGGRSSFRRCLSRSNDSTDCRRDVPPSIGRAGTPPRALNSGARNWPSPRTAARSFSCPRAAAARASFPLVARRRRPTRCRPHPGS